MADTYDVIIVGSGSGGGFLAGEVAPHASVLILEAGPATVGDPAPGFGSPLSRRTSTQINLGQYIPDGVSAINSGKLFYNYPIYMDQSNPVFSAVQREAKIVGGGSQINVGAWIRPLAVDFEGFAEETGVRTWTREDFELHFLKAEQILHVHRDKRENWNPASVLYEQTALSMGIPVMETASNRHRCIFCGHRLDAGMPCKYDSLMSTAVTQIPKAISNGAVLLDNSKVLRVEIENRRATGVTYRRGGETFTARANKLVVLAAGAIGTPAILFDSGVHSLNDNVGRYLRAHPGVAMDALVPGTDWNTDRGYQWNCFHYTMKGEERLDVIHHASAGFPAATPWVAAQVGFFGKPYKDLMRRYRERTGVFLFQLKPNMHGRVIGGTSKPVILYQVADTSGLLEPKTLSDLDAAIRQSAEIFRRMGAIATFPNPNEPTAVFHREITQLVTTAGALHPQSTCRAGIDRANSVVDEDCMSHDVDNLMICDASVIPNHIACNPNSMIMAIGSRCSDFVIAQILGKSVSAGAGLGRQSREAR